ncbi:hypothetical protein [Sphingorhabdus sp.]|uniref:hypothetical protein n=1 Tax=Sphingorhabdus sp. TaxID=1902408 RepID=UPI00391B1EB7
MEWTDPYFWQDYFWAALSLTSATLVLISSFADRRRHRRKNFDDVGFVPWTAITVFSVLATVLSAALAIKGI